MAALAVIPHTDTPFRCTPLLAGRREQGNLPTRATECLIKLYVHGGLQ